MSLCDSKMCLEDDHYGCYGITFQCQLEAGHGGKHRLVLQREDYGEVVVEWDRGMPFVKESSK